MTSSNGHIFRVTGPLCGEFTGDRWIPLTKASDTELWYFLWSAPEQTVQQSIETPVFETPLSSLWRDCNVFVQKGYTRDPCTYCWQQWSLNPDVLYLNYLQHKGRLLYNPNMSQRAKSQSKHQPDVKAFSVNRKVIFKIPRYFFSYCEYHLVNKISKQILACSAASQHDTKLCFTEFM